MSSHACPDALPLHSTALLAYHESAHSAPSRQVDKPIYPVYTLLQRCKHVACRQRPLRRYASSSHHVCGLASRVCSATTYATIWIGPCRMWRYMFCRRSYPSCSGWKWRLPVKKNAIRLLDGRYLLFFTFADETPAPTAGCANDDTAIAPARESDTNACHKRTVDEPFAMGSNVAGVGDICPTAPESDIPSTN